MIDVIRASDVIENCRATLGIPGENDSLDDILLACLLRRCAGILCPCSRTTLRSALSESLRYLDNDPDALAERLDNLIDSLIFGGDLLELADVVMDDTEVKGTQVFVAQPSFVMRSSGAIFLMGIVPDQDTFLPSDLSARVDYDGCVRYIIPEADEDLEATLLTQGLRRLPEDVWLKYPETDTAEEHLSFFERQLDAQPPCGTIKDLKILDSSKPVTYYRGRWVDPSEQTGTFVARRPQEFGAPLWCFVKLADGVAQRLMDLPQSGFNWRGYDAAWHLQMAIDFCQGQPQRYRRHDSEQMARFDFFSPLPAWSERRFIILGTQCPPDRSLLAYEIPRREADSEEHFLQNNLWMVKSNENQPEK